MLLPLVSLLSLCHAPLGTEALQLCRRTLVQECVPKKSSGVRSAKKNDSGSCTWFHSDKQASVKRAYSAWQQVSIVQKSLAGSQIPRPVYLLRNQTQTPKAVMIVHRRAMDTCPGKTGAPALRITPNLNKTVLALSLSRAGNWSKNHEDVWKSMRDVWLSKGITYVSATCRQQKTWSDHSNWMTYTVCSAWRKEYFADGLNTSQVSY